MNANTQKPETPPAFQADFLVSAAARRQFPDGTWPEVALLGRSNAGKSSLLNRWLGRKNLARVGATPGRTRQINFFKVAWLKEADPFCVADLPGYGFAAAPKSMVVSWQDLVAEYLESGRPFRAALLLMDIRRNPQEEEHNLLAWLESLNIPAVVVATKADKFGPGQRSQRLNEIKKLLGLPDLPLAFSSTTGLGREKLIEILGL